MIVIIAFPCPPQGHLWETLAHYLSIRMCLRFIAERWQNLQLLLQSVNLHCNSNFILGTNIPVVKSILGVYKSFSNCIVLSEFALIVNDLHSAPASIKYPEEEEGREGRENRWSTGYSSHSTLHRQKSAVHRHLHKYHPHSSTASARFCSEE